MRIPVSLFCIFLFFRATSQDPVGTWADHLVFNTALNVVAGPADVYASTGSAILVYNKSLKELRKVSRVNGLSETGISAIGWSEEQKTLIIGYTSANIDLLGNSTIYNLPDIARKYIPGRKVINRIRTSGRYAYMASSFGIVVLDLLKKEIYDTWKPGTSSGTPEVYDLAFGNGKIFAATSNGVYSADMNKPGLSFFGNWDLVANLPDPAGKYNFIAWSSGKLVVNLTNPLSGGDSVYIIGDISSLVSFGPNVITTSIEQATQGFTVSTALSVKYYDQNGSLKKTINSYGWGTPDISQAVIDNEDIWIADKKNGLVEGVNLNSFEALTFPGPLSDNAFSITAHNGEAVVTAGGPTSSWNNLVRPLQVSIHENNTWMSFTSSTVIDAMKSLIDPEDNSHIYVSTWGSGLLEYKNNVLLKQYNDANSPLQTIIPGRPYVRVCGLAMDKNRNLWLTQTEVPGSIKVLKPDGQWIVNPITIAAPTIGDIIIAKNGFKWVILPRGYGLFLLDDNKTPENFTDDRSKKLTITDSNGALITNVLSVAEDLDGTIWAGTDQGPFIYYNPANLFDSDMPPLRIKIPRNDGTNLADYMLEKETITCIAVDGANRKWLGTSGSGVYLLSADGTKEVSHFNEQNSPLLSNSIASLAVDNKTGEIWFGTSKGIQSLRGNATEGGERFSGIYSFPNPVREDFSGNVTITGLVRDSEIKITDVSGNLVFQTISDGGQATWDLKNYKGNRVSTGVYLVFCSSGDGTQSAVTKILVIR